MSRAAFRLAAVLLLAGRAAAEGDPRNLLPNPSFEPPADGGDQTNPPGWTRWNEPGAGGRHSWDGLGGRAHRKEGDKTMFALFVESPGGRAGWELAEPLPIKDDRAYVFTGYVSCNRSAGEVRYALRFLGADGVLGEAWTPAVTGSTGPDRQDWVGVGVRVTPPEGTTHLQVILRADHLVGQAWFDDVSLIPAGEAAPDVRIARARALRNIRAEGTDPAAFDAAFAARARAAEAAVTALRRDGKLWQPARIVLERARVEAGAGALDLRAGWERRGWSRLETALRDLERAEGLAAGGGARPDPLPAPVSATPFPVGVVLPIRGPVDGSWLDAQMVSLRNAGFPDVLMDVPWGLWERERGKRDFTLLDRALAGAARAGLTFYGACGPRSVFTAGRWPGAKTSLAGFNDWYLALHPESALASAAGERIRDCDGLFWDFAWVDPARLDSVPAYLKDFEASYRALAARAAGKPGFGGWLLSARPRLGAGPDGQRNLDRAGLLGDNPEYRESFRAWLRTRYGTPARLEAAWGRGAPAEFARAEPPGPAEIRAAERLTASRYAGSAVKIADWLEFRADALAGGVAWQAGLMGGAQGVAAPWLEELSPLGPLDPAGLAPEAFAAAGRGPVAMEMAPDAVPFPLLTHAQDVALSAARPVAGTRPLWLVDYRFHAGGMFGGSDRQDLFPAPYAGVYVAAAVSGGARGFFFNGWTGRPGTSSFTAPPRPGSVSPALSDEGLAAALAGRSWSALRDWLADARPARPRYGILVSRRAQLFDDPKGYDAAAVLNALALIGIHDAGIVTEREVEAGAPPCEVLIAPYVTRLSRRALASVTRWVDDGGFLLADSYLASRGPAGERRRPLGDGLAGLFGVAPVMTGTAWSDEMQIGVRTLPEFVERTPSVGFSLSWFTGGWRVRALPGTEVLARYTVGDGPAITLRAAGRGRTALIPRVALWGPTVDALAAEKVPRPELRELRLGRNMHHLNGLFYALTLRALFERAGALPPARLVRAGVTTEFIDAQSGLLRDTLWPGPTIEWSASTVRTTQHGMPFIARAEVVQLRKTWGVDPEALATVRVSTLERRGPGADAAPSRAVLVSNVSSWGREAWIALPPCAAATDLFTGEEFRVEAGRVRLPLDPYAVRLLSMSP